MSPTARTPVAIRAPLAAALLALVGCGRDASSSPAPAQRAWPAGTVLALNDTPILADEVDAVGSIVARIEVSHTLPDLRRIALTNTIFPRVAARQVAGEQGWSDARSAAQTWSQSRQHDEAPPEVTPAPQVDRVEGRLFEMGMEVWNWALEAPIGTWSAPIESIGAWRVAKVVERTAGLRPADVTLVVDIASFPWSDPSTFPKDLASHLDRSKLTFVDETWRDFVPTLWQRRLRGSP